MKVTIKDVAELAGVSFKTVSRVVNNVKTVDADLQKKVRAAIKTLNYQPNLSARGLRGAPSSIAFVYDNPNCNYVIELQKGILQECHRHSYELVIHPGDSSREGICEELIRAVRRSHAGGLILTPPLSEMPDVALCLIEAEIPFIRIISGSEQPDDSGACVYIDDRHAAANIVQHLVDLGHRDIAFLSGDPEHNSTGERLEGYKEALEKNGIEINESFILDGQYSFESGVERTSSLLALNSKPTAVFACNDEIAAGVLFAARTAGIEVPEQLSIAGFEDSPFSRQTWPKLTTARQPNETIAACAAALLIEKIQGLRDDTKDLDDKLESVGFVPELVIRDSTRKVD